MPKGDKYVDLTRELEASGEDRITMTFKEIEKITGYLPPSAYWRPYSWTNCKGSASFCYGWINAGYTVKIDDFQNQIVTFTKKR